MELIFCIIFSLCIPLLTQNLGGYGIVQNKTFCFGSIVQRSWSSSIILSEDWLEILFTPAHTIIFWGFFSISVYICPTSLILPPIKQRKVGCWANCSSLCFQIWHRRLSDRMTVLELPTAWMRGLWWKLELLIQYFLDSLSHNYYIAKKWI